MVATLVLLTFVIFILVDYYFLTHRKEAVKVVTAIAEEGEPYPLTVVGGFRLPAHLSYHPGHTWAMKESRQMLRIGLDDLAARLVGKIEKLELPARGRWLRQGERAWTLTRGEHRFEMLSPVEGEVVDINEEALRDPGLVHRDPYGAGWLVAVNAPAAESNLKNLLHGRLAQRWIEEAVAALQLRLAPAAGAHLQDGGHAVPDILAVVPEAQWENLTREMFLS